MISERTLKKWRMDAFRGIVPDIGILITQVIDMKKQVLKLTQELLDQHLIKAGKKEIKNDSAPAGSN